MHKPIEVKTVSDPPQDTQYGVRRHDVVLRRKVKESSQASRMVVLVGGSSTGKTRACWEALRHLPMGRWLPWRLWDPVTAQSLLDGLRGHDGADLKPRTVVWLNELHRYLITPGPEIGEEVAAELRRLLGDARGPVLVVGTIWPDSDRLGVLTREPASGQPDLRPQARALLSPEVRITVPETVVGEERAELERAAAGDPRIAAALQQGGSRPIQYLAGAQHLLDRYDRADARSRAVLHAATDAHRVGAQEYLSLAFLETAAQDYLEDVERGRLPSDQVENWVSNVITSDLSNPERGIEGPLSPASPTAAASSSSRGADLYVLADYDYEHSRSTPMTSGHD